MSNYLLRLKHFSWIVIASTLLVATVGGVIAFAQQPTGPTVPVQSAKSSLKSGRTSAPSGGSCGTWNKVPNQVPPHQSSEILLLGVAAISAKDVWAVGSSVIEHWNGTRWSIVPGPTPQPVGSILQGVVALSANNVWAVGTSASSNSYQTLIEHWDGKRWSVVKSPNVGTGMNALAGIAAVSASNLWVVGSYDGSAGFQTLIEHWDGTSWQVVPSPNVGASENSFNGIIALSANNVWAVGYSKQGSTSQQPLIEHWDGVSWSIVAGPNLGAGENGVLGGIVAVPGTNQLWAVGSIFQSPDSSSQTLIEYWNGTSWSVVSSPSPGSFGNMLNSITALSANNIWAVGQYSNSSGPVPLIEHWDGTSWSAVKSPSPGQFGASLLGVAYVPSTSSLWAVGYTQPSVWEEGFTQFYC